MPSTAASRPSVPDVGLLVISAELSAAELMERIALVPDVHWSVGDGMPSGRRRRRSLLRYEAPRTESLGEMVRTLLDRLEPHLPAIRAVSEDPLIEVRLWVGLYIDRVNEEYWLEGSDLIRLAALGANVRLGLDIYCGDEDEGEAGPEAL